MGKINCVNADFCYFCKLLLTSFKFVQINFNLNEIKTFKLLPLKEKLSLPNGINKRVVELNANVFSLFL